MFLVTMRGSSPYLDLDVTMLVFVIGSALVNEYKQQSHGYDDGYDIELRLGWQW